MPWTPRRGASLIHVDDADSMFFGNLRYPLRWIFIRPDVDVIEVAVLLRDILRVANFNRGGSVGARGMANAGERVYEGGWPEMPEVRGHDRASMLLGEGGEHWGVLAG